MNSADPQTEEARDSIPPASDFALKPEPHGIDFFWALRQIQAHATDKPKIGESFHPSEDPICINQPPDLRFASSSLTSYQPAAEGKPGRLEISFMGLFGPNGAMPLHITEYARDRLREGDRTLVTFANFFQHRLFTLFFRSWAVHQKAVDFDRPDAQRFRKYLGSLIGIGMPSMQDRDAIEDTAKVYFSGRLAPHNRNAEGLAAILSEYFGIRATIESFAGRWLRLPEADSCRLGASQATGLLGQTVIVGSRVWECQTKFRVRFGPMRLEDLYRLLPQTDSYKRLKTWVRNYVGDEFEWDAQMVLLASEVPTTQLGGGGFLGWTTWLTTAKPDQDVEDVIFSNN